MLRQSIWNGWCFLNNHSNEILKNSKKITRQTFKRVIDNDSWRYLSNLLGYEVNSRSGMTMAQDEYIDYYRSYFMSVKDLKVYVYFLVQSSNRYYFR
jgi:hypothetical protein